jgi:hypothetical protein
MPDKTLEDEASDIETPPERLHELAQMPTLRQLVAMNPAASADTLRDLVSLGDKQICASVAENPNAPFDLLRDLLDGYAERVLNNPALPFLLLENPALPAKLSRTDLLQILRFERIPRVFLADALHRSSPDIREQALLHVIVAGEAGPNWREDLIRLLGETMALQGVADVRLLSLPDLFPLTFLEALVVREEYHVPLALNPDLTPDMYQLLAIGGNDRVRANLASNPAVPESVLAMLTASEATETRIAVAKHAHASSHLRAASAKDEHFAVRAAVACVETSRDVLASLARDTEIAVREAVAQNHHARAYICDRLAADTAASVRMLVAQHPHVSPDTLENLARDPDARVRAAVALNPYAPAALLERLARGSTPEALEAVASGPGITSEIARHLISLKRAHLRELLAANPSLAPEILAKIAERLDDSAFMRGLARNPKAPPEVLAWLAGHNNVTIRRVVAANPGLPFAAQGRLAETKDGETHFALARNPATALAILARLGSVAPVELLDVIVRHLAMNRATRRSIYAETFARLLGEQSKWMYAGRDLPILHALAIAGDVLPATMSAKSYNSLDWLDRYLVTQSMHSPRWMLLQLSQDGNRFVRAAARASLLTRTVSTLERQQVL